MEKKKKSLGKRIKCVLTAPFRDCKEIGQTFVHGDWKTKVSFLIMGFGPLVRGQILRGIAFLASEIAFIWYMVAFGAKYLKDIGTLGTVQGGFDENYIYTYGDNSFLILLFGILSLFVIVAFLFAWRLNVRVNMNEEKRLKEGRALATIKQDFHSLFDEHFDKTLLALPVTGVFLFVLLPIVFKVR